MFRGHILGHVVRELREQAAAKVRPNEILAWLRDRCGADVHLPYEYLRAAFLQFNQFFFVIGPGVKHFGALPPNEEELAAELIGEHRAEWDGWRFPELLRIRDYFSFLELARDERLIITVCDAEPGSEGYRLHGVYDADSGESAWSAKRGEKLRASINRKLGDELVLFGPHDDWEHRNDRRVAGSLWGPQTPVIEFNPQGEIDNHLTIEDLATSWTYQRHWDRLYPHHPVNR